MQPESRLRDQTIFCRSPRMDLPFRWATADLLFGRNMRSKVDANMGLWAGLAEKSQEADHSGALSWPVTFQTDRDHRASYRTS